MKYYSVAEIAKKWNISERSVRNYCANRRIEGAVLIGKTWNIPEGATKPERINKSQKEKNILFYATCSKGLSTDSGFSTFCGLFIKSLTRLIAKTPRIGIIALVKYVP